MLPIPFPPILYIEYVVFVMQPGQVTMKTIVPPTMNIVNTEHKLTQALTALSRLCSAIMQLTDSTHERYYTA